MANNATRGVVNGLGTFNFGVPEVGTYNVHGTISLPTLATGSPANSQVVVTVTINSGATIYTGLAGEGGFDFNYAVPSDNSIFNITLSSSASIDQGLNVIKTTVTIAETT